MTFTMDQESVTLTYILTQEGKLHDWREIITCGWCRGSGIPRSSVDDLRDCWSCDGRGYRMRRWA